MLLQNLLGVQARVRRMIKRVATQTNLAVLVEEARLVTSHVFVIGMNGNDKHVML